MATPSVVQTATEVAVSSASSSTINLTVTAANMMVALIHKHDTAARGYTLSDDKGNTWANAVTVDNGSAGQTQAQINYAKNIASGATVITCSVDFSLSSTWWWTVCEVANCDTTTPLDQTSSKVESGSGNNHTCSASASVIDTTTDVIVFCATSTNAPFTAAAAGSGYTDMSLSQTAYGIWQYKTSASALTDEQGAWSNTGTARIGYGCIASFAAPASPPASSSMLTLLGVGK